MFRNGGCCGCSTVSEEESNREAVKLMIKFFNGLIKEDSHCKDWTATEIGRLGLNLMRREGVKTDGS